MLETGPKGRIFAGLKPGTTRADLEQALARKKVADLLASFSPRPAMRFLCEREPFTRSPTSWCSRSRKIATSRFVSTTGIMSTPRPASRRPLQVEQAMACLDLSQVAIGPVPPAVETTDPALRERLLHCPHFTVWRHRGDSPFAVGAVDTPRILVSIAGSGELDHGGKGYPFGEGDVVLLPAEVGKCSYRPDRQTACLLEVALPDGPQQETEAPR